MRALAVALALAALARPAAARPEYPAFHLEMTAGAVALSPADNLFTGSGHRPGGVDETVTVRGRQLGLAGPHPFNFGAHVLVEPVAHLAVGLTAGILTGSRDAAAFSDSRFGTDLDGGYVGGEARFTWAWDWFEAHGGVSVGWRWLGVPIFEFAPDVCSRGGRCHPAARADFAFVEPRLTLFAKLRGFDVGGYVGGDVLPTGGWIAGGLIGFSSNVLPASRRRRH
jgi:hypothetical protein